MVKPVPGPDRLEKGLRLGCGGLVGLAVGFLVALRIARVAPILSHGEMQPLAWGITAGTGILCAVLALRHGDNFWMGWFGSRYVKPWDRGPRDR